ncbi:uncharacterized protein LOC128674292 [Plodia interpunctella]|uniref:uncharacterized protein LOC128674292 n=1 Tax=Plodia interpunctella TaxID=58824 RepID=UPI0023683CB7|nr:uncharacterized protein LOC128674292 [Plodia interpunctella]XP_053608754.1 uncharacterized protein LOC128674292 [Plodia interpunctella]
MRWINLIFICAVLSRTLAEPEPKKYNPETRNKNSNASLTDEERKFLREVEAKFGIKSDVLSETKKDNEVKNKTENTPAIKPPFPAVIAIEIVNDTETKQKNGKRTIDANLGYGYKTNSGYSYTYLGRPSQEKGKFMIYPYSQEDIPPARSNHYQSQNSFGSGFNTKSSTDIEIQPSKAFELVEMQDEPQAYNYNKPTEQRLNYESIKGLVTPPPYTPQNHQQSSHTSTPTTLYTTYNGEQLSGLSGQFPMVMPNYFVDPSQLLKYPQFQSAGLSQDHLRSSGSPAQQKVVPVLVLRIPSSYLKNPTAELYANLPQNYPLSQYLNHVNLQELVNNYFKKIGYSYAPQVTAYQSPLLSDAVSTPVTQYEPQHYASPYIHPSYTQSDYSGVQYSAVKPVMAKYPLSYSSPQHYITAAQTTYQQPNQQYQYTYQYVPNTASQQAYYVQPQQAENHQPEQIVVQQVHSQDTASQIEYVPQQEARATPVASSLQYAAPETQGEVQHAAQSPSPQYESAQLVQEYATPKPENAVYTSEQPALDYAGPTRLSLPVGYTSSPPEYGLPKQSAHQETIAVYPSQSGHIPRHYSSQADAQSYYYQNQGTGDSQNHNLVLTENYPSKDHTIATVLPYSYKQSGKSASRQTVSYVTPSPFASKYQSQYTVMVPQTVFKNPSSENVSYVNSHSLPYSQNSQEQNPEVEYTVPSHYSPPVGRQKPPSLPKNYHSHPKRMTKAQAKSDNASEKKSSENSEKKNA